MDNLLIFSHPKDPVTNWLLKNQAKLSNSWRLLSLQELIESVIVHDKITSEKTYIEWVLADGFCITESSHFVLNRILDIPYYLFEDFCPEDRQYAQQEFRAFLTHALEAFCFISSRPASFGLGCNHESLPHMWERALKAGFMVPDYQMGDISSFTYSENNPIVFSNPYELYYWRPGNKVKKSTFSFSRPAGIPMGIFCTKHRNRIFFPDEEINISSSEIGEIVKNLRKISAAHIFESLLFIDKDKSTFGMISEVPLMSSCFSWFSEIMFEFFSSGDYLVA